MVFRCIDHTAPCGAMIGASARWPTGSFLPGATRPTSIALAFHYCGEAVVDGHPCIKLRGDVRTGQRDQLTVRLFYSWPPIGITSRSSSNLQWQPRLQRDSNRREPLRRLPRGRSGHLVSVPRQRVVLRYLGKLAHGRILLNRSSRLSDRVGDDVAEGRQCSVPRCDRSRRDHGPVLDEDGKRLGEYDQPQEGVAAITPARFLELRSQADVTKEEAQGPPQGDRSADRQARPRVSAGRRVAQQQTFRRGRRCGARSSSSTSGPSGAGRAAAKRAQSLA